MATLPCSFVMVLLCCAVNVMTINPEQHSDNTPQKGQLVKIFNNISISTDDRTQNKTTTNTALSLNISNAESYQKGRPVRVEISGESNGIRTVLHNTTYTTPATESLEPRQKHVTSQLSTTSSTEPPMKPVTSQYHWNNTTSPTTEPLEPIQKPVTSPLNNTTSTTPATEPLEPIQKPVTSPLNNTMPATEPLEPTQKHVTSQYLTTATANDMTESTEKISQSTHIDSVEPDDVIKTTTSNHITEQIEPIQHVKTTTNSYVTEGTEPNVLPPKTTTANIITERTEPSRIKTTRSKNITEGIEPVEPVGSKITNVMEQTYPTEALLIPTKTTREPVEQIMINTTSLPTEPGAMKTISHVTEPSVVRTTSHVTEPGVARTTSHVTEPSVARTTSHVTEPGVVRTTSHMTEPGAGRTTSHVTEPGVARTTSHMTEPGAARTTSHVTSGLLPISKGNGTQTPSGERPDITEPTEFPIQLPTPDTTINSTEPLEKKPKIPNEQQLNTKYTTAPQNMTTVPHTLNTTLVTRPCTLNTTTVTIPSTLNTTVVTRPNIVYPASSTIQEASHTSQSTLQNFELVGTTSLTSNTGLSAATLIIKTSQSSSALQTLSSDQREIRPTESASFQTSGIITSNTMTSPVATGDMSITSVLSSSTGSPTSHIVPSSSETVQQLPVTSLTPTLHLVSSSAKLGSFTTVITSTTTFSANTATVTLTTKNQDNKYSTDSINERTSEFTKGATIPPKKMPLTTLSPKKGSPTIAIKKGKDTKEIIVPTSKTSVENKPGGDKGVSKSETKEDTKATEKPPRIVPTTTSLHTTKHKTLVPTPTLVHMLETDKTFATKKIKITLPVKTTTIPDYPQFFIEIRLRMSWQEFCENNNLFQSIVAKLLQYKLTADDVSGDQIFILNYKKCQKLHFLFRYRRKVNARYAQQDKVYRHKRDEGRVNIPEEAPPIKEVEIVVQFCIRNRRNYFDPVYTKLCYQLIQEPIMKIMMDAFPSFKGKLVGYKLVHGERTRQSLNPELLTINMPAGVIVAISIASIAGICLGLLIILQVVVIKKRRGKKLLHSSAENRRHMSFDEYSLGSMNMTPKFKRAGSFTSSRKSGQGSARSSRSFKAGRRKYSNLYGYNNVAVQLDVELPSNPLDLYRLNKVCRKLDEINEEFQTLPNNMPRMSQVPIGAEDKNRFANVIPFRETRVPLKPIPCEANSDYINANYVKGYMGEPKSYIATQAPLENTMDDFWRMIWQEQCHVIVMLTALQEDGLTKCSAYFPHEATVDTIQVHGDYGIVVKDKQTKQDWTISKLTLKDIELNLCREVIHYWYTAWPDGNAIPQSSLSFIKFIQLIRPVEEESHGPTVVHCSPGTGRTGTYLAIDLCMRSYNDSRIVDVPNTVHNIRQQRGGAVQTKRQYSYIYKTLQEYGSMLSNPSASSSCDSLDKW